MMRDGAAVVTHPMVREPERPLPDLVEEMFESLAGVLEQSGRKGAAFETFRRHTMLRVRAGQELYGERWRDEDMIPEALEELPDAAVYGFAEMAKLGERDADLYDAVMHAFLSYVAFCRHKAKRAGSP